MPNNIMITTENDLKKSADNPVAFTKVERKRVNRVKLRINPTTIPIGLLCPPLIEPESTMGRTGRMQGESTVTRPAKKENTIRIPIH